MVDCLARSYDYLLALSNGLDPCIGEASAFQFQSVFLPLSSYPFITMAGEQCGEAFDRR